MNKTTKRTSKNSGLSIKRETIRTMTPAETRDIVGGKPCTSESCQGHTCPNTVCTITVDETL